MASSKHHTDSPSFPRPDDSFWDVPRLHKDKIYREQRRPATAVTSLPQPHVGVPASPEPVTLLDYRSKSSTSVPTSKSIGLSISPTSSVDMSASRFSFDSKSLSGSIDSQNDRSASIAQNLRAKGSRLMKRQTRKFNLRTLEWAEESNELWTRGNARYNRLQSMGTNTKPEISEPYNFQHLTHTHRRHFQEMSRASHHDLVSEFSAIRASQAPRRELQGIKAQCLQSRALQSEPTSPARQNFISPPRSPLKPTYHEPARSPTHQHSQSADYFSQPSPRLYKTRSSTSPIVPPPRSSSRAAVPGFSADDKVPSCKGIAPTTTSPQHSIYFSKPSAPTDCGSEALDYSEVPHAVTTLDNSASTLTSPPFRAPKAELADVPEEDDDGRVTAPIPTRPSTAGSGLHHSKSFPNTRSNSQSWSRSPLKAKARDSGSQYSQSDDWLSPSEVMLPLVGEPDDDIPLRPRLSKRMSLKAPSFDASWEDDIDYCYEHAAEADCDFEWDQISLRDTEEPNNVGVDPTHADHMNSDHQAAFSEDASPQLLPRLETSVPSLCSADSAKSSSFSSIAGPPTPCYPLPSPQPLGLPGKGSVLASAPHPLNPLLLVSKDSSSMLQEEAYENIFLNHHYPEDSMPVHNWRFEPPTSREDSPRSSHSPISKCNSQESFIVSRSSSFRYIRSNDSMASLPDLVHSKSSRDGLNLSQDQLGELAATLKASESFPQSAIPAPLWQRSSQSLAKEVARQSMLQKAGSFGSFDEEEEHEIDHVVVLPNISHHERSQSVAVPQPATAPLYPQRKRSATSASTMTKDRISYSLFPSPPARTP